MNLSNPKLSDTNFTNMDAGMLQTSAFASPGNFIYQDVLQGTPAAVKVSISEEGVTKIGAPNQFAARVSLTQKTLQLTGHVLNAQNVNRDPAVTGFT